MTRSTPALALVVLFLNGLAVHAGPRLDQIQVIGTHNSYHIQPHPSLLEMIRSRSPVDAAGIKYTHRPLTQQFEMLGIRQIELDVYADPEGGRFAEPMGRTIAERQGLMAVPLRHLEALRTPGAKILHVPDFDFGTTVATLRAALQEIVRWSTNHPAHVPIAIMVEFKHEAAGPEFTPTLPWTRERMLALEQEILENVPRPLLLTPDEVRGASRTLRDAVRGHGWPALATVRGKIFFAMDNGGDVQEAYLQGNPTLEGRLLFTSVAEDHPAAAWFKINDPIADQDRIRRLVREGFLVRTRADASTTQARSNDVAQREAAIASGAQWISTDFAEPFLPWSDYVVAWTNDIVARANLLSDLPPVLLERDLEELAVPGGEPFHPRELELLNLRALRHHQRRSLTDASRDYARLLQLEPVASVTDEQRQLMLALAPVLLTHEAEPFRLEAVAAFHHPTRPLVAFHLFWGDDIDFPEDNDPTDHEVIWVGYEPNLKRPVEVWTYFHGRLLRSRSTPGEELQVAVEWGKHGSLPISGGLLQDPPLLRAHWERLHGTGIRLPDHPLAAAWPKKFSGSFDNYRTFDRRVDLRGRLEGTNHCRVTRWANAALDQHVLAINFAPKTEWPE